MRGLRIFAAAVLAVVCGAVAAQAGEPPKEPMLRIETGMHAAMINRVGVDSAGRYLVTASDDKTLRVWDIASGQLLSTIRPPAGGGAQEGMLHAVALSPDGNVIAAGGWTGYEWDEAVSIYLFDRASGRMLRKIGGLPNVIIHLAFSKDGRYLAATLWGKYGLRVFRTSDYSLSAEDKEYGGDSNWADFDASGRLVTSSFDGFIRLYDAAFRLIAKVNGNSGKQPFTVSFSPDGEKVAVGYADSTGVDVLNGRDLAHLYSPGTKGVKNGDLSEVAWSWDGQSLYAGGTWDVNGFVSIRRWSHAGKGEYNDFPVSTNTIVHIAPLAGDKVLVGSGEPSWSLFGADGQKIISRTAFIADYRDNRTGFQLSHDGFKVRFGYQFHGKSPAVFNAITRQFESDTESAKLRSPITEDANLKVTDWKNTGAPELNGSPLTLRQYEESRSLAIAPNRQSFLLGTDWTIYHFDSAGKVKWKFATPGVTWGLNVSGDGSTAVAAFGDGTIRWYRMSDGKEILAFFPHADQKRWALWTPKGYYDASAGGEDLIGWHINNGSADAADFFPASRFRSSYYRPDVIAKLLDTKDEGEAVRLANAESGRRQEAAKVQDMLPPVVSIVSPGDAVETGASSIKVRVSVRSPSGAEVTSVKPYVDGRVAESGNRALKRKPSDDGTYELEVPLPGRDCMVSVIAENKFSASVPAIVRVSWKGAVTAAGGVDGFVLKPKLYALVIGVSKYQDKDMQLAFAAKDAADFAAALKRQEGGLYQKVEVRLLTDEKAVKDEVLDGLDWVKHQATEKDIAIIYISGHGVNDENGNFYYLPANTNVEKLMRTGVPYTDIKNTLTGLASKAILFIDTCHSGNVMGGRRAAEAVNTTALVNELSSAENGVIVFTSSTGRQYSLESEKWGNGAFTKALVEGLDGKADMMGKGKVSVAMLSAYLSERVKEITGGKQTPTTAIPGTVPDYPIALKGNTPPAPGKKQK